MIDSTDQFMGEMTKEKYINEIMHVCIYSVYRHKFRGLSRPGNGVDFLTINIFFRLSINSFDRYKVYPHKFTSVFCTEDKQVLILKSFKGKGVRWGEEMEREKYVETQYTYLILKIHKLGGGGGGGHTRTPSSGSTNAQLWTGIKLSHFNHSLCLFWCFYSVRNNLLFCNLKKTNRIYLMIFITYLLIYWSNLLFFQVKKNSKIIRFIITALGSWSGISTKIRYYLYT